MDLAPLWDFIRPRNVADLFIDCEATLFLPILIMGYKTGFFRRLLRKMMGKEGWLAW